MSEHFSDQTTPPMFEHIIDRDQTALPLDYLPNAPGVVVASKHILRAAGDIPGRHPPRGWVKYAPGVFRRRIGRTLLSLQVRQGVDAKTDQWAIERLCRQELVLAPPTVDALVCAFSRRPIWASRSQGAMWLAEHCYPLPRSIVAAHWVRAY